MQSFKRRRWCAGLLGAALLVGCLAVGGILPASGAAVTGAAAEALAAAPETVSLIGGKAPIANNASDHTKNMSYQSSLEPLTDGAYPGINALVQPVRDAAGALQNTNDSHPEWGIKNNAGDLVTRFSCWTNDYIDLTFDLGEENQVGGFAVGSTAEPSALLQTQVSDWTDEQIEERYKALAQTSLRLFKGTFYVADTAAALFETAAVAAQWDYSGETAPQAVQFTLNQVRSGRYVGFRLYIGTGWASLFRIGELAVFGVGDSRFVTGATVASCSAAPTGINRLLGLEPIANAASTHSKTQVYQGKMAALTDDRFPGVNDPVYPLRDWSGALQLVNDAHPEYGIKTNVQEQTAVFSCWTNDYIDLTFDLGQTRTVTGFAVGSTAEPQAIAPDAAAAMTDAQLMERFAATAAKNLRLYKGAFYVAAEPSALFGEGTCVTAWDFTGGETPLAAQYLPETAAEGRYVGFRLYVGTGWASLIRIGELAVYADPYGDSVTGGTAQALTAAPEETSLIAGRLPLEGAAAALTDGAYPGVTVSVRPVRDAAGNLQNADDTHPEYGVRHDADTLAAALPCSSAGYVDLTFDLGGEQQLRSFAVGSTAHPRTIAVGQLENMTDAEIIRYFGEQADRGLWLAQGALFLSDTPETLFIDDACAARWNFTEQEPVQALHCVLHRERTGRYVGFRLYARDIWNGVVRVGELAVFGEPVERIPELPVAGIATETAYAVAADGKNNLLKGTMIPGMTEDYLTHSGSAIVNGAPESALTDGSIDWTGSQAAETLVLAPEGDSGFAALTYDMQGVARADFLLIANSARTAESSRLTQVWVYASGERSTLYAKESCKGMATLSVTDLASRIDLSGVGVQGRYIGIRLPAGAGYPLHGYARLTELGVYGVYPDPGTIRPRAHNLLEESGPVLTDYFTVPARTIRNRTAVSADGTPGRENIGTVPETERTGFWREDDPAKLTDGSTDTLCSMITYGAPDAAGQEGNGLLYNTPWTVYVYYLGGNMRLNTLSLISTDAKNLNIAGVQFYAAQHYEDLFKNESLLYTTGGEYFTGDAESGYLPDDRYTVYDRTISYDLTDQQYAATYRYVAYVVTRPYPLYQQGTDRRVLGYNSARIAELQALGTVESPEEPLKTSYAVTTELGTVTVNIAPRDYDDRTFFENLGTVTVTREPLGADVQKNIANNWLTVVGDCAYHVRMYDKAGQQLTQGGERDVEVVFPVDPGVTWLSGRLVNGQIQRLYNGNTRMDGTLRAGENQYPLYAENLPNNRDKATIREVDFSVVLLRYNDKETIYRLNGAVENPSIDAFFGTAVAGVSAAAPTAVSGKGWRLWWLAALLPAVAAVGAVCRNRKRRQGGAAR